MFKSTLPIPDYACSVTLGCDPEFFFKNTVNKRIIGAEKVLPKDGLQVSGKGSKIIIDGVQGELNPRPNECRGVLGTEIATCFKALNKTLNSGNKNTAVSFKQSIKISKSELRKLDEKNQKFGCSPSLSTSKNGVDFEKVDPLTMRQRGAGGHIHIGLNRWRDDGRKTRDGYPVILEYDKADTVRIEALVDFMDIILGNTMVIIDRDPGNKERRKLYGRAGEYRLPPHGVEYRTLSNFWLHSCEMMSLVMGITKMCGRLVTSNNWKIYHKAFTDLVDMEDVHKAINTNNLVLAKKNFKKILPTLCHLFPDSNYGSYAFGKENVLQFLYFLKVTQEKGMKHWWPNDPMTNWLNVDDGHNHGFNDFLNNRVRERMLWCHSRARDAVTKGDLGAEDLYKDIFMKYELGHNTSPRPMLWSGVLDIRNFTSVLGHDQTRW